LVIGVVALAIALVIVLYGHSQPSCRYMAVDAPYAFLVPQDGGLYELGYYNARNSGLTWAFNLSSNALQSAVNIINQINKMPDPRYLNYTMCRSNYQAT
jgi:hypothetical protein